MKSTVIIRKCDSYEPAAVQDAVAAAVEAAGGIGSIVKPGDRVLLKINLLNAAKPERAVVTHPEVVRAMIRLVKSAGGEVVVGDAPGLDLPGHGKKVLRTSGAAQVCEEEGVIARPFAEKGFVEVTESTNRLMQTLHIAREVAEADVVIGLSKAKSHMQAVYTGAIKNFFGTLPSKDRKRSHSYVNLQDFSESLVDIFAACKPTFGLMDGIMAMEGRGPSDGNPRKLGLVLASHDFVALDRVTSTCMGYDRLVIPHIDLAAKRGLGVGNLDRITIDGPAIAEVRQEFKAPPNTAALPIPAFIQRFALGLFKVEPLVTVRCVTCGHCASVCPVEAIEMGPEMAQIDYSKCIGCFCCHELCPISAILERRSLLAHLFTLFGRIQDRLRKKQID